jgi:SAM-dependent methyltransferase
MINGILGEGFASLIPRSRIDTDHGSTARMTIDHALDFLELTVHDFPQRLRGKAVLDYGCGKGWQCCALAKLGIVSSITGVDIRLFDSMAESARASGVEGQVQFVTHDQLDRQYDVVYSCSSFEHFADPEAVLRKMITLTRPGGEVIISFAEPWFSPAGSHMTGYTGLPWSNLIFSERALMRIRSRYRSDGATRYSEVEGGLNQMTVAKFERIMRSAPEVEISELRLFAVKKLPLVTSLPVVRELFTSAVSCTLVKRGAN